MFLDLHARVRDFALKSELRFPKTGDTGHGRVDDWRVWPQVRAAGRWAGRQRGGAGRRAVLAWPASSRQLLTGSGCGEDGVGVRIRNRRIEVRGAENSRTERG